MRGLATWAVIQDIALDGQQRKSAAGALFLKPRQLPYFQAIQTGFVSEAQIAGRGELTAVYILLVMWQRQDSFQTVEPSQMLNMSLIRSVLLKHRFWNYTQPNWQT